VHHNTHQSGWAGVGIATEINDGPGLIQNNYIHDNSGAGIAIWESQGNVISGNKLVNDSIAWRDLTNRGYRSRNNRIQSNQFYQGQVNPAPGNAGNVISGNVQTSNPGAPAGW
jgi:parallel beta-helix repeat protein